MITHNKQENLATTSEVMEYLGVSRTFIGKEIKNNKIKAYKIAGQYKFRWNDILDYVEAQNEKKEDNRQHTPATKQ